MTTERENNLIQTAADIWQDNLKELAFQHVMLCHLSLPRLKTDVCEFERRGGNALLKLKAGEIYNGLDHVPRLLNGT